MIEVKICGINDLAAMDAALDAGADMVGLVFFTASPRAVAPAEAARLAARARNRALIAALVVDADDALLQSICDQAAPDLFQLHGKETPARAAEIRRRFARPIAKALPVETRDDLKAIADYAPIADRILFDARPPRDATRPGGHGRTFGKE
jgi:phosphoribosylanthranilate isomerase